MRFFLVARDRVDGTLTMLSPRAFHAREDAMDALLADPPALRPFTDVFAVDLDGSTPVLLMSPRAEQPAASQAAEQPVADRSVAVADPAPGGRSQWSDIDSRSSSVSVAFSDLTCDDCIYRSACRDAHTSAPAACRSFQRRVG